jgi:hypothetical protein
MLPRFFAFACVACLMLAPAARAEDMPATQPAHADAAMMEEMARLSTPTAEHAMLKKYVGDFTADVTMYHGDQPAKSIGTLHNEMALGDRFLMGTYEGDFMGQPFQGMSCTGYDVGKQKYFSAWIDSMSTALMYATGEASEDGKTLTLTCEMYCPLNKDVVNFRQIWTFIDDDTFKMEMHGPMPGGDEVKMMEITYTRNKAE